MVDGGCSWLSSKLLRVARDETFCYFGETSTLRIREIV